CGGQVAKPVPAYVTTTETRYQPSAAGVLMPLEVRNSASQIPDGPYLRTATPAVSAATQGIAFQKLVLHVADHAGASPRRSAGAALVAVGTFDPWKVANIAATPSPYLGERLTGADAASRKRLGWGPLSPPGPAGYPSAGASLVMPVQDIGAFAGYTGTAAGAPVGTIRVRVAGASAGNAESLERIRAVATEIVRATGLDVDVLFTAAAITRTVDLTAHRNGQPALNVQETWYRSEAQTTVATALDPRRVALAVLVLLVGTAFAANASEAARRARRRELLILRALGWRRSQLGRQILAEFVVTALLSALAAVVMAIAIQA